MPWESVGNPFFFSQEICFLFFPFVFHSLDFGERTSLSLSSLSQGVKTSSIFFVPYVLHKRHKLSTFV